MVENVDIVNGTAKKENVCAMMFCDVDPNVRFCVLKVLFAVFELLRNKQL